MILNLLPYWPESIEYVRSLSLRHQPYGVGRPQTPFVCFVFPIGLLYLGIYRSEETLDI